MDICILLFVCCRMLLGLLVRRIICIGQYCEYKIGYLLFEPGSFKRSTSTRRGNIGTNLDPSFYQRVSQLLHTYMPLYLINQGWSGKPLQILHRRLRGPRSNMVQHGFTSMALMSARLYTPKVIQGRVLCTDICTMKKKINKLYAVILQV